MFVSGFFCFIGEMLHNVSKGTRPKQTYISHSRKLIVEQLCRECQQTASSRHNSSTHTLRYTKHMTPCPKETSSQQAAEGQILRCLSRSECSRGQRETGLLMPFRVSNFPSIPYSILQRERERERRILHPCSQPDWAD